MKTELASGPSNLPVRSVLAAANPGTAFGALDLLFLIVAGIGPLGNVGSRTVC